LTALQKLNLSGNKIGPDGAIALVGGFKLMSSLQELDLSHNNICTEGAVALADGLRHLTKLSCCKLYYNRIDLAGAKAVITSLKECEHLEKLLIEGLDSLPKICYISIRDLVRPDDTVALSEIKEAAQHAFKHRTLDLGFERVAVSPKFTLSALISGNRTRVFLGNRPPAKRFKQNV